MEAPERDWDPDTIVANLAMEEEHTGDSQPRIGRRRLQNASAMAASQVINLALYSTDEGMRYKASLKILEFVYGSPSTGSPMTADADDKLTKMLKEITGVDA